MNNFKIYYPIKPLFITQPFGATYNLSYYEANGIKGLKGHNGIDMLAKTGQPVYASHDGIAYSEEDSNQGYGVVLITKNKFDYEGGQVFFKSIYWHLLPNIPVTSGQEIKAGDLLGYADSTGLSTGAHLHFSIKPVENNEPAFAWINVHQNNGYLGNIDATPYFNSLFAEDIQGFQFNDNLKLMDSGYAVKELQLKLQKLGYFPSAQECTGYYGPITAKAVLSFQIAKIPDLTFQEKNIFRGYYFGPKSRATLNAL